MNIGKFDYINVHKDSIKTQEIEIVRNDKKNEDKIGVYYDRKNGRGWFTVNERI